MLSHMVVAQDVVVVPLHKLRANGTYASGEVLENVRVCRPVGHRPHRSVVRSLRAGCDGLESCRGRSHRIAWVRHRVECRTVEMFRAERVRRGPGVIDEAVLAVLEAEVDALMADD